MDGMEGGLGEHMCGKAGAMKSNKLHKKHNLTRNGTEHVSNCSKYLQSDAKSLLLNNEKSVVMVTQQSINKLFKMQAGLLGTALIPEFFWWRSSIRVDESCRCRLGVSNTASSMPDLLIYLHTQCVCV